MVDAATRSAGMMFVSSSSKHMALYWVAAITVTVCAAAAQAKQHAVCQLALKGHGYKEGIQYGSLNCSTDDGSPLIVGVNRTYAGQSIKLRGVVARDDLRCSVANGDYGSDSESRLSIRDIPLAILSFCGPYHLHFVNMIIQDVYRENYAQCGQLPNLLSSWSDGPLPSRPQVYPCWVVKLTMTSADIFNGTFKNNSAGSVIGIVDVQLVIQESHFVNNSAANGAAIAAWSLHPENNKLILANSVFTLNTAGGRDMWDIWDMQGTISNKVQAAASQTGTFLDYACGGAVSVYGSDIKVINSTFDSNKANFGGAIVLYGNSNGSFSISSFRGNVASDAGGAIYAILTTTSSLLLDGVLLDDNEACSGAAMYLDGSDDGCGTRGPVPLTTRILSDPGTACYDSSCGCIARIFNSAVNNSNFGVFSCQNDDTKAAIDATIQHLHIANSSINGSSCSGINYDGQREGFQIISSNVTCNGQSLRDPRSRATQNCSAIEATYVVISGTSLISDNGGTYGGGVHVRSVVNSGEGSWSTLSTPSPFDLVLDQPYPAGLLRVFPPSRIIRNFAAEAGGGVFCDDWPCAIEYGNATGLQEIVYGNDAMVAKDIFVPPKAFSLLNSSFDANGHVVVLTADGDVPVILHVMGSAGIPIADVSFAAQVTSDSAKFKGKYTNITTANGTLVFLLRIPLGHYNVAVSLDAMPDSPYHAYAPYSRPLRQGCDSSDCGRSASQSITYEFEFSLLTCYPGQIVNVDRFCQMCPRGSYSPSVDAHDCKPCLEGAVCLGPVIVPLAGYWQSSRLTTQLHKCPNPDACQQNSSPAFQTLISDCTNVSRVGTTANGLATQFAACGRLQAMIVKSDLSIRAFSGLLCSVGYTGTLCGVCKRDDGYALVKPFTCSQCIRPGIIVCLLILGWAVLLCMIKVLCYVTLQESPAATPDHQLQVTSILKPFVLYLQYMLIVSNLVVKWPAPFAYPSLALSVLYSSAAGEAISISCLLSDSPAWPLAIRRILFYLAMPVVTLIALLVLECGWYALGVFRRPHSRRPSHNSSLTNHLMGSAVVVLFFFLPSLARTTFDLFACIKVDEETATTVSAAAAGLFWMFDMNQRCYAYDGYHRLWAFSLGVPMVFLLCVVAPVGIVCIVITKYNNVMTNTQDSYAFLYRMYKPSRCYWEAVVTVQTLVLIAISVFGYNVGAYAQAVMLSFALALILVILIVIKPYAERTTHVVMCQGIACTFTTSYFALTFWFDGFVSGFAPGVVYRNVAAICLLTMNVAYIVSVIWRLHLHFDWKVLSAAAIARVSNAWPIRYCVGCRFFRLEE